MLNQSFFFVSIHTHHGTKKYQGLKMCYLYNAKLQ